MLLWSLLAATSASAAPATDDAFGVSFAGAPINDINISISNVKQCGDAVISWSGTQGPVEVTIGTGGYYVGSTTLNTFSGLQGDSTTWKVNLPAGSDTLIFQVKDSTGNLKYKQGVTVEKSSDSSCLEGGSSSSSASSASPVPSSSESEQTPEPSTSSTSTSDSDSASSSTSDHETSPSAAPTPSTSEEPTPSSKSSIPEPVSSSGAGASPTSSGEDISSSASPSGGDGSSASPGGSSSSSPRGTSSVSPSDSGSSSSATEIPSSQTLGEASAPSAGFASSAVTVSVSSKSNLAAHTTQPIIENTSVPPASKETPKTQTTIVPAPAPVVPGSDSKGSADAAKPSTAAAPVITETVSSAVPNAAQPAQPSAPASSSTTSRSVVYVTSIRTNSSLNPAIQTATVVGDSKGASLSLQDSGASRSLTGVTGVFAAALAVLAAAVL